MIKPIDYVMYRVWQLYGGDNSPKATSFPTPVLSAVETTNFLTLYLLYKYWSGSTFKIGNALFLVGILAVYAVNDYVYMRKGRVAGLAVIWKDENPNERRQHGYFVVSYFAVSLLAFIVAVLLASNARQ